MDHCCLALEEEETLAREQGKIKELENSVLLDTLSFMNTCEFQV